MLEEIACSRSSRSARVLFMNAACFLVCGGLSVRRHARSQCQYHKAAKTSGLGAGLYGRIVFGNIVEGGVVEIVEFGIQAPHGY